jgi:hypothetical protein
MWGKTTNKGIRSNLAIFQEITIGDIRKSDKQAMFITLTGKPVTFHFQRYL